MSSSCSGSWRRLTGDDDVGVVVVGGDGDVDVGNVNIIVNICQHYFNTPVIAIIVAVSPPLSRQDEIFSLCISNYPGPGIS